MAVTSRPNLDDRSITLTHLPRPIPPRFARADLHRLLDEALEAVAAHDALAPDPQGPGRIADQG